MVIWPRKWWRLTSNDHPKCGFKHPKIITFAIKHGDVAYIYICIYIYGILLSWCFMTAKRANRIRMTIGLMVMKYHHIPLHRFRYWYKCIVYMQYVYIYTINIHKPTYSRRVLFHPPSRNRSSSSPGALASHLRGFSSGTTRRNARSWPRCWRWSRAAGWWPWAFATRCLGETAGMRWQLETDDGFFLAERV